MKGYKLTDIESENMLMIEIDKALPNSDDINNYEIGDNGICSKNCKVR